MLQLPFYINITFIVIVVATVALFYQASHKSKTALVLLLGWSLLQSVLGYSGFYTVNTTVPPRFMLLIAPTIFIIVILFLTKRGKHFINQLDIKWLTLIHAVRLPVEIVLFWLFVQKAIPQVMTFEGRNFDIMMGISAPLVYYFSFIKNRLPGSVLLAWNILGVLLVLNVASTGVVSVPSPFQQFGFEQPNIAVLYFPFNLLPALVVPLVLFSHFASIRKIVQTSIKVKRNDNANVVIFPPLLFFITIVVAVSAKFVLPEISFPTGLQQLGYILLVIGFVILFIAVRQLNKINTTVHPDGVTNAIVSHGIFKYSRNPIYVSFTLFYLGVVLLLSAIAGLVLLVPLLIITQKGIIEREEKYLLNKFGEEYAHYKSTVRRWI